MNELEILAAEIGIHVQQTNRIHPDEVMNADPLIEGVMSLALIAILGCLLALLRLLL